MIDSTAVIPISEIVAIGQTLNFARKSIAVQWFIGNASIVITCISIAALIVLVSRIKPNDTTPIKIRQFNTKGTLITAGVFVAGIILSQVLLTLSGVLIWCVLFGTGMAFYLKWSAWFIRRSHKIPVGWVLSLFVVIGLTTISFNLLPSMVAANENVQEVFTTATR